MLNLSNRRRWRISSQLPQENLGVLGMTPDCSVIDE
jgi:hypothetical protein